MTQSGVTTASDYWPKNLSVKAGLLKKMRLQENASQARIIEMGSKICAKDQKIRIITILYD